MGEIYKIVCSCGYSHDEIFLGVGMSDWYPSLALCKKCGLITSADFHNNMVPKCERCSEILFAYDSSQLIKNIAIEDKEEFKYYCPTCQNFTLELHEAGCWD